MHKRQVVAFLGAKGGVGTTTLAVNLAVLLATEQRRLTAVVDLASPHGDAGDLLGLDVQRARTDASRPALSSGDPRSLLQETARGAGGVRVLEYARDHDAGMALSVDDLRLLFDVSIIDTPHHRAGSLMHALVNADTAVIVSAMSAPSARAAHRLRERLGAGDSAARVHLVLNRIEANNDLDRAGVEAIAGMQASAQAPYDPAIVAPSVNRGSPFVLAHPEAQVTRRIRDLADALGLLATPSADQD